MSHSCCHISSHKHQLHFFRGKKWSFETKPGVSLDNTYPSVSTVHLLRLTEKIFSMLVSDCWHVGWCFRSLDFISTHTGQALHLKHQQFCSCINIFKFRTGLTSYVCYEQQAHGLAGHILKDPTHAVFPVFEQLPSGRRLCCLARKTQRRRATSWTLKRHTDFKYPTPLTPSNTPRKTFAIQYLVSGKCNFSWQ